MAAIRLSANVPLTLAEDVQVAAGNVFAVATREEAERLEEIGAARILDRDDPREAGAGPADGGA